MTKPIRLWTCSSHHTAFRCGGWASICEIGGETGGVAGGERATTAPRMALAGLAAGLARLTPVPAGAAAQPIRIETGNPALAVYAGILANFERPAGDAPDQDLDLWARIITAAKGRRLELVLMPPATDTPIAFAAAWADLAMERAKGRGAFTAAIPRANLSKIAGLG